MMARRNPPCRLMPIGLLAAGLVLSGLAVAGPQEEAAKTLKESRRIQGIIQEQAPTEVPNWLRSRQAISPKVLAQMRGPRPFQKGRKCREGNACAEANQRTGTALFVSWAMDRPNLKAALQLAASREMPVYLRGLIPGTRSIGDTMKQVRQITEGIQPTPRVFMDPSLYEEYQIEQVPTFVWQGVDDRLARIAGGGLDYMLNRVEAIPAGDAQDFGQRGQTWPVAEEHLTRTIKKRIDGIDWDRQREKAIANFWNRDRFVSLPPAQKRRVRRIKPAFRVKSTIKTVDDEVLARKGERFNVLEAMPFPKRVIVFDAGEPKQVATAKRLSDQSDKATLFLTTGLNQDGGWEAWQEISGKLPGPMYLLTPTLKKRFGLEKTPTFVEEAASGNRFKVVEVPVDPA